MYCRNIFIVQLLEIIHTARRFMPTNFTDWIDLWTQHFDDFKNIASNEGVDPFCCYSPVNLMAGHLSCANTDNIVRSQFAQFDADRMRDLKQIMGNLSFIGLQEAYHESLCLWKIQHEDRFPAECDCEAQGVTQSESHVDHGVTSHHVSDYSEDTWRKVDKLSAIDIELYEFGKARFLEEARKAEDKHQRKFMCRALGLSSVVEDDQSETSTLNSIQGKSDSNAMACSAWEPWAEQLGISPQ